MVSDRTGDRAETIVRSKLAIACTTMVAREGIRLIAERHIEELPVLLIIPQRVEPRIRGGETELNRMPAVHRNQRLVFQLRQGGIGRRQRRRVHDVDQAHTAARVHLTRGTDASGATIREGSCLFVTAAA